LATLPAAVLAVALRVWLPPTTLVAILAEGLVVAMIYVGAVVIVALDRRTRGTYTAELLGACRALFLKRDAIAELD
jgi:hypothetical protein